MLIPFHTFCMQTQYTAEEITRKFKVLSMKKGQFSKECMQMMNSRTNHFVDVLLAINLKCLKSLVMVIRYCQ